MIIYSSSTIFNCYNKRLPLDYDIIIKNHSIIYQLKANGLIDDLSFTFVRKQSELTFNMIYFRQTPNNITDDLYKSSKS